MSDLSTKYLGLNLNHVVGFASPLSESLDNIKRLEDTAWRAWSCVVI